jgi:mono/diheme cytochrome c family protein
LAESQVLNPPVKRTATSRESIANGRAMFLGRTKEKLECWGCHGPNAKGNGPSFIDQRIFERIVFNREPLEQAAREVYELDEWLAQGAAAHGHGGEGGHESAAPAAGDLDQFLKKAQELWKQSVDDWGQPLRAADLNKGVYKGGRRPIDIYWRIAKGINGAKMPGHGSALKPEQIWDLVNFVLALPYDQDLLRGATAPGPAPKLAAPAARPPGAEATRLAGP